MVLAFLPGDHIREAFAKVAGRLTDDSDERLHDLVHYFDRQWMSCSVWPPSSWSVFKETVRTNNDVEGQFLYIVNRLLLGNY